MTDDRPSIAELQRLCRDDSANHGADLALAAPVLLEIAAAALAWRDKTYGPGPESPVDVLLAALSKVTP